ncbi:2'-5' RNA ligase family protein [Halarchaeum sp. CBA1220]|uniref:2'-5' RNA ligase family protein n=1 Tax=Halarchaeum sp. CBA1220 TaxID=1853682 RepID=UPI000F3A81F9|nr:2'-5' RNA ligase family protein [Halarchaeum sp. CBA1220]QLC33457.1 2'-5' RNA ligase family protein [Halarchaeum sp. CBA1220]
MYSVSVPVPPVVRELIREFRPLLTGFDRVRGQRTATLVVKRLDADDRREYLRAAREAKRALRGAPTFDARISDVGVFEEPTGGTAPVVYLAVESPGLWEVHRQLVAELGRVPGLEGDDYTPHVTLARDGPPDAVERVRDYDFDPVTWTVNELEFYDAEHKERIETVSLPA